MVTGHADLSIVTRQDLVGLSCVMQQVGLPYWLGLSYWVRLHRSNINIQYIHGISGKSHPHFASTNMVPGAHVNVMYPLFGTYTLYIEGLVCSRSSTHPAVGNSIQIFHKRYKEAELGLKYDLYMTVNCFFSVIPNIWEEKINVTINVTIIADSIQKNPKRYTNFNLHSKWLSVKSVIFVGHIFPMWRSKDKIVAFRK